MIKPEEANAETDVKNFFAHCFSTHDGRKVLSFLRQITIERCLGADIKSEELFYMEGQRSLVKYIERLADSCR